MSDDTTIAQWGRVIAAWCGNVAASVASSITIQSLVLGLTGIYTLLQIYILWRDKIRPNDRRDGDMP